MAPRRKAKVIFYTYPSCTSCRKTKEWLNRHGIPYEERHIFRDPPSPDELKEMFRLTTEGTDELLSKRSQVFKSLGVDIENLRFTELLELLHREPRLLRRPIITYGDHLIVGYDREALEVLLALA
ncbi:MAG TPA: Spx/MgsR family RNA polymerase-binding regulatory protein [Bacillaceae bacterium]|nr:Spx/MgsR family RNA polymerase-binding regulatory protein [Bacillaceae bacterium]